MATSVLDSFTAVETIVRKWKRRGSRTVIVHPYGDMSKQTIQIIGEEAEFIDDKFTGNVRADGRNVNGVTSDVVGRSYTVPNIFGDGTPVVVKGRDVVLFLMAFDADERGKLLKVETIAAIQRPVVVAQEALNAASTALFGAQSDIRNATNAYIVALGTEGEAAATTAKADAEAALTAAQDAVNAATAVLVAAKATADAAIAALG